MTPNLPVRGPSRAPLPAAGPALAAGLFFLPAAIEKATNGAVTRRDLRPDDWQRIWPELAEPAKAAA